MELIKMNQSVDQNRWNDAQSMELWHMLRDTANEECHMHGTKVIFEDHFNIDYQSYFKNKTIVESGGGRFPHVIFCDGVKNKISVEPLFDKLDEYSQKYQVDNGVQVIQCAFEDYKKPDDLIVDEVWFFNVLQHVKDPILQIKKAKEISKTIRVFEPINVPTDTAHPHIFDVNFFEKHFPESIVKKYIPDPKFAPFFGTECAYLVWEKV
jgi:hypothetical protein